ncbi:Not1 N-terminal domain, CCR4-Not complex component-domain-containing protein [Globomyces pollinis-pini]|nr:Not1 N-terminal domain, CCR4-Not complex component-domain-containing protein [Globomyces pollinis-pini]
MANRKLLVEIERTLKKVSEGVDTFESIYDKIQTVTNVSQKNKFEGDLKREIKKLQRYRDQIKTWAASNDIKDKRSLLESRTLIETQMEKFKAMEKELKTKAFSQAGLNAQNRLDPEEIHKEDLRQWISDQTDILSTQIDAFEAEQETLQIVGKKNKRNDKDKAERLKKIHNHIERHKFHQAKLEIVLRMIDNGKVNPDDVDELRPDVEYYIANNQEDDYMEDDSIYETLDLDDAETFGLGNDGHEDHEPIKEVETKKPEPEAKTKKSAASNRKNLKNQATAAKEEAVKPPLPKPVGLPPRPPVPVVPRATAPTPVEVAPVPTTTLKYATVAAAAASGTPIKAPKSPERKVASPPAPTSSMISSIVAGNSGKTKKVNSTTTIASPVLEKRTPTKSTTVNSTVTNSPRPTMASILGSKDPIIQPKEEQPEFIPAPEPLPLDTKRQHPSYNDLVASFEAAKRRAVQNDVVYRNKMLEVSFETCPTGIDSVRAKSNIPKNPYPVPMYYPQTALTIFNSTALFSKFDIDTLFFIFYYRPGTYQQFLAIRELKKQNWRFHKKYSTWFQRLEEPSEVNDSFERGTYVYFDYEKTWTQRKKIDFHFEYKYLEDDQL